MLAHVLVTTAAVAALSTSDVRHPAIDGGPVLGQPRAAVVRSFAENGWTHEPARSGRDTAFFGQAGVHLDVTITFDRGGKARAARVRPWRDETSEAFIARHYAGLLRWLMGAGRYKIAKQFENGELVGLDVGL